MKSLFTILMFWALIGSSAVVYRSDLNTNQFTVTSAAVTIKNGAIVTNLNVTSLTNSGLTGSRAMVTDANKASASSATTDTEVGYLSGVTSAIQTQLNTKLSGSLLGMVGLLTTNSVIFTNINAANLAAGLNDLYTVPTGYRMMQCASLFSTTNATSATVWIGVKTNGSYWRLSGSNSAATNTVTSITSPLTTFLWDQNELLAVSNSVVGANVFFSGVLIPTSVPLVCYKSYSLAAADNTLYTVTTGKRGFGVVNQASLVSVQGPQFGYFNNSTASRTIKLYYVPSGGSVGQNTQLINFVTVSVATSITIANVPTMASGDSISLNTDSTASGQIAWVTVWEQ